MASINIASV
jgi:hypothetical protein